MLSIQDWTYVALELLGWIGLTVLPMVNFLINYSCWHLVSVYDISLVDCSFFQYLAMVKYCYYYLMIGNYWHLNGGVRLSANRILPQKVVSPCHGKRHTNNNKSKENADSNLPIKYFTVCTDGCHISTFDLWNFTEILLIQHTCRYNSIQ